MNTKVNHKQIGTGAKALMAKPDFVRANARDRKQPQIRKSLEKATKSLALAYLVANMNFKHIPLKEFMDAFEKKILLACLRLTRRNQKDAAAMLRLKPTALIEKMRKHGIQGRRKKLYREPQAPLP
ncbi:MAG: hypothetical protein IH584_00865, partial [Candidatus Aminicenantes bacterium]|nr:hypothetical protein [Candidatus Aminicenantes bacterium]